jgi:hypothetical protein
MSKYTTLESTIRALGQHVARKHKVDDKTVPTIATVATPGQEPIAQLPTDGPETEFVAVRNKHAQIKHKIIDESNPGVNEMDRIEKVSPSFLEALKKVQENGAELSEKKKMTKADIAALKHPKGKIDANDLAALRAGEHKKKVDEEAEQIDESLTAAHKTAITKHVKKMWGKGDISFDKQDGKHFVSHSDGVQTQVHSIHMKKGVPHVTHFMSMDEETLDEAQFISIQKGMDKKRIRNNPYEIMRARKEGWAIQEETLEETEQIDELFQEVIWEMLDAGYEILDES